MRVFARFGQRSLVTCAAHGASSAGRRTCLRAVRRILVRSTIADSPVNPKGGAFSNLAAYMPLGLKGKLPGPIL